MQQTHTTPVPNEFFDYWLSKLSYPELKVLQVVIRSTYGWRNPKTGKRKQRDWIAGSQFQLRTGLSRKAISCAITNLSRKGLLRVTDYGGFPLEHSAERKGQKKLFYTAFPKLASGNTPTCVSRAHSYA